MSHHPVSVHSAKVTLASLKGKDVAPRVLVVIASGRFVPRAMPSGPRESDGRMEKAVLKGPGDHWMMCHLHPHRRPMNLVTTRKPAA